MVAKRKIHLNLQPSKVGPLTGVVEVDGLSPFYLHSSYDPEQEADDWLGAVELSPYTLYIVLGVGLGYHIRSLLENLPEGCRIVAVEPYEEYTFLGIIKTVLPATGWLGDDRLKILHGTIMRDISTGLASMMLNDTKIHRVVVCPHFPSMQVFPEHYAELQSDLLEELQAKFLINLGVGLNNNVFFFNNAWRNLPHVFSRPGITGLKNVFLNRPVIVVSAGPSLNKNIHILKQCLDQAVIIACGSALGALHKAGIVPHILASVDPFPETYLGLKDFLSEKTILLASNDTSNELIAKYPGPKMFVEISGNMLSELRELFPATAYLRRNVSVTTTVLDFAIYISANPIIIIGQDCAIYDDVTHADGVQGSYELQSNDGLPTVHGQDGSMLKTTLGLKDVLQYIQLFIKMNSNKTIINATEGGAFISGAVQLPLEQVRREYLSNTFQIHEPLSQNINNYIQNNPCALINKLREIKSELLVLKEYVEMHAGCINEDDKLSDITAMLDFSQSVQSITGYSVIAPVVDSVILFARFKYRDRVDDNQMQDFLKVAKYKLLFGINDVVTRIEENIIILEQYN